MTEKKSDSRNIVVFGATSDIAQAVIKRYADRKARLVLVARDAHKVSAVAQDAEARGGQAFVVAGDLGNIASLAGIVSAVQLKLATKPDVILIAHGVLGEHSNMMADWQATEELMRVNVLSPIVLLQEYMKAVSDWQGITVAVISSVAGLRGRRTNFLYGASKAALNSFCAGLRAELTTRGAHLVTVLPGFVATKMTAHLKQGALFATPTKVGDDIVRAIERRQDVLYTPWFWRWIMLILLHIPERIFKKMNV